MSGAAEVWWGDGLAEDDTVAAGDFVHIPAGVPRLPVNPSEAEPMLAVIARTDPNEQESVVLCRNWTAWSASDPAGRSDRPVIRLGLEKVVDPVHVVNQIHHLPASRPR